MEKCPALIIFLDCLGPDEIDFLDWLPKYVKGGIESGIPRVTPHVISGILTGELPPYHGVLCPTMLHQEDIERPRCNTIIEEYASTRRILNFEC